MYSDIILTITAIADSYDTMMHDIYDDINIHLITRCDIKYHKFMYLDCWSYRNRLQNVAMIMMARFIVSLVTGDLHTDIVLVNSKSLHPP